MDLSFMQNEIVLALCWTLIHSLWQGLLLATVTGAVMIGTRKSSAGRRYRLLTVLFFVFLAVSVATFVIEYRSISNAGATTVSPAAPSITDPGFFDIRFTESTDAVSKPLLERFKDYFNTHASLIVMIWFVIFIARFIRLAANLVYVNRLKHYKTFAPPVEWSERINELVLALGLKRKIKLLESGVVKVPVVMGVLKPIVLLPLGMLAHLPAEEIEAILLHELAHIQRRDYLVNLLQNFAETIFFFNPALMWVSSMIREERENCCDDIAIAVTNSKSRFINALIAFQEYNFSAKPSVGFAGRKNQLLNRVKRIVNEKNKTLNAAEKSILTFAMGVFILFSFAAAKKIAPPAVKQVLSSLEMKHADITNKITEAQQIKYDTLKISKKGNLTTIEGDVVIEKPPTDSGKRDGYKIYANYVEFTDNLKTATIHFDTVPLKTKSVPLRLSNRSVFGEEKDQVVEERRYPLDSISKQFTNITSNSNNDELTVSATHKNGTEYKFRKLDGVVKEFYINGVASDASTHMQIINDIEKAFEYRRTRVKERHNIELARRDEMRTLKLRNIEERRKNERANGVEERKLRGLIKLDKLNSEKDSVRSADRRVIELKLKGLDSLRTNFKKEGNPDKIKDGVVKNGDKRFTIKGKVDVKTGYMTEVTRDEYKLFADEKVKQYGEVIEYSKDKMRTVRDTATRIVSERARTAQLNKIDLMRMRAEKDRVRHEANAELFRSIIADLEKEGVKIDLEKSWIALDKGQFLVDGKTMPKEMHEKFIARYVTSGDGWGYYYGPIQVRGRGIVFDYKDLAK